MTHKATVQFSIGVNPGDSPQLGHRQALEGVKTAVDSILSSSDPGAEFKDYVKRGVLGSIRVTSLDCPE